MCRQSWLAASAQQMLPGIKMSRCAPKVSDRDPEQEWADSFLYPTRSGDTLKWGGSDSH